MARKAVVATTKINVGDKFSDTNINALRAGPGRSPMEIWSLYGETSLFAYEPGDIIAPDEGNL